MKTTVEIADELFEQAQMRARSSGRTLRSLVEEGLRTILATPTARPYRMPDRSVGDPSAPDPLESRTWQDLRAEIYGDV